ncbi:MAG: hypothetical protein JWO11_794 [Nocardioides sp.]|nr:hypothetical protein [Nocardioides sp.]
MTVHATAAHWPVFGMTNIEDAQERPLPLTAGEAEWVADLVDTFRAGDLDAAVDTLDALLATMRKAAKARRMLTTVDAPLLRKGLELSAHRLGTLA